jgi:hypothetical protein
MNYDADLSGCDSLVDRDLERRRMSFARFQLHDARAWQGYLRPTGPIIS